MISLVTARRSAPDLPEGEEKRHFEKPDLEFFPGRTVLIKVPTLTVNQNPILKHHLFCTFNIQNR